MVCISLNNAPFGVVAKHWCNWKSFGLGLFLGAGSLLTFNSGAIAVETIELRYQGTTFTTTPEQIQTYAETGEASAEFLQFIEGDTTLPDIISNLLVREIRVTGSFREKLQQDLESSSIGQFVLLKLDELVAGSQDLSNLQLAIRESVDDNNEFSLLEVIENYPEAEATVDLDGVVRIYNDVQGFVERVLPALEIAREYLQDYLCECETPAATTNETTDETVDEAADETMNETPDETTEESPQSQRLGNEVIPVAASQRSNCEDATMTVRQPAATQLTNNNL